MSREIGFALNLDLKPFEKNLATAQKKLQDEFEKSSAQVRESLNEALSGELVVSAQNGGSASGKAFKDAFDQAAASITEKIGSDIAATMAEAGGGLSKGMGTASQSGESLVTVLKTAGVAAASIGTILGVQFMTALALIKPALASIAAGFKGMRDVVSRMPKSWADVKELIAGAIPSIRQILTGIEGILKGTSAGSKELGAVLDRMKQLAETAHKVSMAMIPTVARLQNQSAAAKRVADYVALVALYSDPIAKKFGAGADKMRELSKASEALAKETRTINRLVGAFSFLVKAVDAGKNPTETLKRKFAELATAGKRKFGETAEYIRKKLPEAFEKAKASAKEMWSAIMGPIGKILAAIALVAAAAGGIFLKAISSARDYQRSLAQVTTQFQAMMGDTTGAMTGQFQTGLRQLGEDIRATLGFAAADTNQAFSTLLTKAFNDPKKAASATILAANLAAKTGRPIQDMASKIAEAANGSASAIQELIPGLKLTGDAAVDGAAAMAALQKTFGGGMAQALNPMDKLRSTFGALFITLGEKILPILNPIIERVNHFVSGLINTQEGQAILEGIADGFKRATEFVGQAIVVVSNFVSMVASGFPVLRDSIVSVVASMVSSLATALDEAFTNFDNIKTIIAGLLDWIGKAVMQLLGQFPGGEALAKQLGLDSIGEKLMASLPSGKGLSDKLGLQQVSKDFAAMGQEAGAMAQAGLQPFLDDQQAFFDSMSGRKSGDLNNFANRMADAGRAREEEAAARATANSQGPLGAGRTAMDAKEKQSRAELRNRAEGFGVLDVGTQINLRQRNPEWNRKVAPR